VKLFDTGENIALKKGEKELKAELDRIINELIQEGFIDELAKKYDLEWGRF